MKALGENQVCLVLHLSSRERYIFDSQKKVLGEKTSLPRAFLFSLSKEKFKLKFEVVN
jgi:hypothetical protein